jgi:hypothetical protein
MRKLTKLKPKRRLRRKEEVGRAVYRQALVKVWKHGSPRRFTYSIQIEGEYVGSDPYVGVHTGSQVCHHGDCAGVQIAFAKAREHIDSILGEVQ